MLKILFLSASTIDLEFVVFFGDVKPRFCLSAQLCDYKWNFEEDAGHATARP
jgi:hypothetical protein